VIRICHEMDLESKKRAIRFILSGEPSIFDPIDKEKPGTFRSQAFASSMALSATRI